MHLLFSEGTCKDEKATDTVQVQSHCAVYCDTATCVRYQTDSLEIMVFVFPEPNLNNLAKLVIRLFFW